MISRESEIELNNVLNNKQIKDKIIKEEENKKKKTPTKIISSIQDDQINNEGRNVLVPNINEKLDSTVDSTVDKSTTMDAVSQEVENIDELDTTIDNLLTNMNEGNNFSEQETNDKASDSFLENIDLFLEEIDDSTKEDIYYEEGKDYDSEYDDYQKKGKTLRSYGELSRQWEASGGEVTRDKYNVPVLDIDATIRKGEIKPKDLFNFLLKVPRSEEGHESMNLLINTSNLTPDERRELDKHKEYLLSLGIRGTALKDQNNTLNKNQNIFKLAGRAITDVINSVINFIPALSLSAIKGELLEAGVNADSDEIKRLGEAPQLNLTGLYDKQLGTKEPNTFRDKVLSNLIEWMVPLGGIKKGSVLLSLGKMATGGAISGSAKGLLDELVLTEEQKKDGIKRETPLLDFAIDLMSGYFGIKSADKILKKISQEKTLTANEFAELQKMQKQFVTGNFQKELEKELRDNLMFNLKQELYNFKGVFDRPQGIRMFSGRDIEKAQTIFNNVTKQADYNIIDDLIAKNIPFENNTTLPFVQDREATSKVADLFKNNNIAELKTAITDDLLKNVKTTIQNKVKQAGENYEAIIKSLQEEKINSADIINKNKEILTDIITPDEANIVEKLNIKLKNAETVKDLIGIQRLIADNIYASSNDTRKYILTKVNNNIRDYFKEQANKNKNFQSIFEANEQYSVAKADITKDREILEKLLGGRDHFKKPENRVLEESTVAYEAYKKLTPEQQDRLIALANLGDENVFEQISKTTLNPEKFHTYSNLELKNAFGKKSEEIIALSKQLRDPLNLNEASKQVLDMYKKDIIDTNSFKEFFQNSPVWSKIQPWVDNVIEEHDIFKESKFFSYIKRGNINEAVKSIKSSADVDLIEKMGKTLLGKLGDSHADVVYFSDFVKQIKEQKAHDLETSFEKLVEKTENKFSDSSIKQVLSYIKANKDIFAKIYNDPKHYIRKNFQQLENSLQQIQQQYNNIIEDAKNMADSNKYWGNYLKAVGKKNKKNEKLEQSIANIPLLLFSGNVVNATIGNLLGGLFLNICNHIKSRLSSKQIKKMSQDINYFSDIIQYNANLGKYWEDNKRLIFDHFIRPVVKNEEKQDGRPE